MLDPTQVSLLQCIEACAQCNQRLSQPHLLSCPFNDPHWYITPVADQLRQRQQEQSRVHAEQYAALVDETKTPG
jgi:hypothetical protein